LFLSLFCLAVFIPRYLSPYFWPLPLMLCHTSPFSPLLPPRWEFFHSKLWGTDYLTCRLKIIKITWKLWPLYQTDRHPDIQTSRQTERQTSHERINSLSRRIGDFARSVNYNYYCHNDIWINFAQYFSLISTILQFRQIHYRALVYITSRAL